VHEILRFLAEGVTNTPPPVPDNSVKIAIITAISVVLAAAITAISATFTRRGRDEDHQSDQDYVDELVRRSEVAERRSTRLENQRDSLLDRVDELERYCWRAGIDPNTGDPVVPTRSGGDES
jgi:hypothetical protein